MSDDITAERLKEVGLVENNDPLTPRTVDSHVAGYMADAAGHLAELTANFETVKWRMFRGEQNLMDLVGVRTALRLLKHDLDMVQAQLYGRSQTP